MTDERDEDHVDPSFPGNPDEPVDGTEGLPDEVADGDLGDDEEDPRGP